MKKTTMWVVAALCSTSMAGSAWATDGMSDGFIDLGALGGRSSIANGVSADGTVVVGSATGEVERAFRWTQNRVAAIGTLGGAQSAALGVSADGQVVVGGSNTTDDAAYHAFRWVFGATGGVAGNAQMTDLGTLGGAWSRANGVSADGSVVVGNPNSQV